MAFLKVVSRFERARDCVSTSAWGCVSVGQHNPLRQVMWVSNPLEGYRIPSSAVHSLSAPGQTLTGPRARACQARSQSDGEPPPWCMGPWLSPTHLPLRLHTQGPTVTATRSRCTLRCVCGGVHARRRWVHVHVSLRVWGCANKGSMQIKIFPAGLLSVCPRGSGYFHYCREIHSNPSTLSVNDTRSQRTPGFNSEGH